LSLDSLKHSENFSTNVTNRCELKPKGLHVFFLAYEFLESGRLCLAIYDFEACIMLSLCLTFKGTVPDYTGMRKI